MPFRKRKNYFDNLNQTLKKYQYVINFLTIVIGFTGLIVTTSQFISTNIALKQSLYAFRGEQFPILSFKTLNKDQGMLQIENVIPNDMLFQFANVFWHPSMSKKIDNPPIKIHDKIWFLTPLTTYLKYVTDFEPYFKKYKKNNYLICEMPAALGINYIKYGESRMIYALYDIEFTISKEVDSTIKPKYNLELKGAYLLRYLNPDSNINNELGQSDFISVIGGS
jgi:hypothetical protein